MFRFRKTSANIQDDKQGISVTLDELLCLRFTSQRLNWFTPHTAQSLQAGNKLSHARGRGMEFSEVRGYQPGDDIRLINWQMTARTGKPYTKVYQEERERPVYLIVDTGTTMRFGTQVAFKQVIAARVAALIAWAALSHHDQVGGIVFNDHDKQIILPKRHRKTLLQLLACISDYTTRSIEERAQPKRSMLLSSLMQLQQHRLQGATICVLSDFMNCSTPALSVLRGLSQKNDVTLLFTYDYLEQHAPKAGLYPVSDGQQQLTINTTEPTQATLYTEDFATRWNTLETLCRTSRCHFLPLVTNHDLINTLNKRGRVYA